MLIAFLLTLLFAAHLLCMNVAGAGPLISCWLEWREGKGDPLAGRAGRFLAGVSLLLFGLGMLLGLAYGWALWTPDYRRALSLVGSRVYFGVWELAFSAVLMAAHWLWWRAAPNTKAGLRVARAFLPLLSSTNLLYHFPFLFVIIAQLLATNDEAAIPFSSGEFRARMADGFVLARVAHFWLASFAAAGVTLIVYALWLGRRNAAQAEAGRVAVWGGRVALVPTLLQVPVGLWLLAQVPGQAQSRLVGGDLIGTGLFGAGVLLAVWLMHQLAAVALGDARRSKLMGALVSLALVVILMTGVLLRAAHAQ